MELFQTKVVEKIKTCVYILYPITFSPKIAPFMR